MIEIKNLNKYYNKGRKNQIHVINNTNVSLPNVGLVSLLGPSGCGKTTLLNAIGGLDKVNKGKIYIDNKKITKRCANQVDKIRNLKIGYIFQDYKLLDNMSVYDNVAIVLKMIGIKNKKEVKKRVEYILERLGIYRYRHRPCSMLSGGERQRVGIARALVKNPDIILADEPTGNLDSKNTIEIMNIIKTISRDKLVILVTHETEIAKFYSDRIIELQDGKIIKDYENTDSGSLDYKIDNKFYLKDFKYKNINKDNHINIDMYSDKEDDLNLVVVIKNGNIYIKSKNKDKLEFVTEDSNIEFINDNYKKLDKDIYLKYSFDYDKIISKDYKQKYTSIFNIFTIFTNGFKKVFEYKFLKKLLLLGFFLSALFVTYSVSNLFGLFEIKDKEFIQMDNNYLKYTMKKGDNINYQEYLEYLKYDSVDYIIPGSSKVGLNLIPGKYYQFSSYSFNASLVSYNKVSKSDIIYGRMPINDKEILIDTMTYNKMNEIEMNGIYKVDMLLDKEVVLKDDLLKYKIVGIVSLGSPSIYVSENEFINIIDNSYEVEDDYPYYDTYYEEENMKKVYDHTLYNDKIKIVKGNLPTNDYEVIVNYDFREEFKLNSYLEKTKIAGNKLKVVGYYTSPYNFDYYFVNKNTVMINLITESDSLIIYSSDKEQTINQFNINNKNLMDIYENDKSKYVGEKSQTTLASFVVAIVILAISLFEIMFMTRSSFLSRIKEVGIYRAIGVKKSDIYKMFVGEAFAISTLTSLPAVLIMSYCLKIISSISYIGMDYKMDLFITILCLIITYGFNILVSLLPVIGTLVKTPAQILSRHDLD